MIYNLIINSNNNIDGENYSNYSYNFDWTVMEQGQYNIAYNFTTSGIKYVQSIPILKNISTNENFITNTLNITDVFLNYEYALSNGTNYETLQSSVTGANYGFYAFNNNTTPYISANGNYDTTTGLYIGITSTTTNIGDILGEWIQVKLSHFLKLTSFNILNASSSNNCKIKDFSLLGSNDGTSWTVINSSSFTTTIILTEESFLTGSNTTFYQYFRIIIKNTYIGLIAANTRVQLVKLSLFGDTYPVNNATSLILEIESIGSQKTYITNQITEAKNTNIIGTVPLHKMYSISSNFNSLVNTLSRPTSNKFKINIKDFNGNLFNIGESYILILSFKKI